MQVVNQGVTQDVSLAVLLDNARTAIAAARDAGLDIQSIGISPADFEAVREAKEFELRVGVPLRLFGIAIESDDEVSLGAVRL